jgi:epoxyqueuosine reductase QueG
MGPETQHDLSAATLSERAKALALGLGFDRVGVAPAAPTRNTERLREWVARGYAGSMAWI